LEVGEDFERGVLFDEDAHELDSLLANPQVGVEHKWRDFLQVGLFLVDIEQACSDDGSKVQESIEDLYFVLLEQVGVNAGQDKILVVF
jgi:hypothetical protein